jgi:hypothetical protein
MLDGKCKLNSDSSLIVDRQRKKAFPAVLEPDIRKAIGSYVWSNSANVHATANIQRALILEGAHVPANADVSDAIITPWGDIAVE